MMAMDIIKMSLSASVMIVAIVIIRALALHNLSKRTFLVLWGVVICRLLIPFSIPSRISFFTGIDLVKSIFADKTAITSSGGIMTIPDMANMAGAVEPMGASSPAASVSLLQIVWLAGICACALFFIVAYIKCRREFRSSLPMENGYADRWLREHPLRRPVQIRQSDRVKSPLTYGVFRPVILLPRRTDWSNETGLRYILTHEFTHIRRFDTLAKLVLTAAVCVHWFNPLVWVMFIMANRDIELSCDETVIRKYGEAAKSAYALTLIGLEEKKGRLTPLVNNFSKNAIEERVVSIMKIKRTSLVGIILSLVLVIGTTAAFATSAVNPKKVNIKAEASVPASVSAPASTVEKVPAASPQDDSTKSGTGVSTAEPTGSVTKDAAGSQSPAPANADVGEGTDHNASDGYPMDQNGWWTYGNVLMRKALGLDYDADLMEAIGTEGQSGYIRTADRESNAPSTPDEYRTIPLFNVNQYVIGAFVLSTSVDIRNGAYISATQEPSYPKNSKGETYGNIYMTQALGYEPDLTAATGTDGQSGYIRESDSPGANVSTLEEAAEYMEWLKTQPSTILIPLYDQEGNVIGTFGVSNSPVKNYDTLEEAQEAVRNGG